MKNTFLLLAISIALSLSGQLRINEIMTNNVSAIMDESFNYSMWVELYNESATSTDNQSSYYFTDDLSQPQKWRPSSKLIRARGYAVLWFERDDRFGHANFKLDPEGGYLYLLNASEQVVDIVKYPAQFRNTSYGRKSDGADEWVFFEQFSPGASNNNSVFAQERCAPPVMKLPGGFYSGVKSISFENPLVGDTIYYSLNGDEPTRNNNRYSLGQVISVSSTTIVRAKTFSDKKLSSDIVTATYFINERNFNLPVVSIVTEKKNLTDNTIGIYVQGSNGITGRGMNTPANWNQDWSRPANIELYDTTLTVQLNQELDIAIAGGWTRMNPQKSLKINPRQKFGDKLLRYDIFAANKPNMKYRSIMLRNSGNDFDHSMMRDGFMQSLISKRMNLDYIAYEPAVCFINGVYYGIQNLRERSNKDFVYSNYGLSEDEIVLVESDEMNSNSEFKKLTSYASNNDVTNNTVYEKLCEMMDIDNFMDYFISEIYLRNTDWPHNNIKAWKKKEGGKWRWILFDLDFGYNLWGNDHTHNTLTWALGEHSNSDPARNLWSTILLKRLILNETFRKRLADKFAIQIATTFNPVRANLILDSIAAKISTEIVHHKAKWGSGRNFNDDVDIMKRFSLNRPTAMLNFVSDRLLRSTATLPIGISSNNAKAQYTFNAEIIQDAHVKLNYYKNQNYSISPAVIAGFEFKHWIVSKGIGATTLISNGSDWKYFDGNTIPASNWNAKLYSDQSWKSGKAQLGYGGKGEVTTISYGTDPNKKYPTAYFRKKVHISDVSAKDDFTINTFVDDGAIVYVNGTEVGRVNMPTGAITFNTFSTNFNNGVTGIFSVPKNLIVEGENVVAVEVHQTSYTSSDLIFNLAMTCTASTDEQIVTLPAYSGVLTSSFNIKAIYEQSVYEDPDKDMRVFINEVVSSNNQIPDEHGDKDDYIELYNAGDEEVNIGGWYVTDTPYNPVLMKIPDSDASKTTIGPKEFLVLWADDTPIQGVLHLNFKLSKEGEKVVLSRNNYLGELVVVDSVTVPFLDQNLSYSRVPDGSSTWMINAMTCNYSNNINSEIIENAASQISIYPSVVTDYIQIENAMGEMANIYDLAGFLLLSYSCDDNHQTIATSNLTPGIYVLTVGSQRIKIIKL